MRSNIVSLESAYVAACAQDCASLPRRAALSEDSGWAVLRGARQAVALQQSGVGPPAAIHVGGGAHAGASGHPARAPSGLARGRARRESPRPPGQGGTRRTRARVVERWGPGLQPPDGEEHALCGVVLAADAGPSPSVRIAPLRSFDFTSEPLPIEVRARVLRELHQFVAAVVRLGDTDQFQPPVMLSHVPPHFWRGLGASARRTAASNQPR